MANWPRTLADEPELMNELRVHRDVPFDPAQRTTEVIAPCCGRRVLADVVMDVRAVPGTIMRGGGYRDPEDHGWLCDGCRWRLCADPSNDWTEFKLAERTGAPAVVLRNLRTRERLDELARADFVAGRRHDPQSATLMAVAEVALEINAA